MKTLKLAVIGKDVSKSDSPAMHGFIAGKLGFAVDYAKISLAPEEFESSVEALFTELDGFNVTIPYKLAVMPYLDGIEGDARAFGAVNTVDCGSRKGYNTDGLGFALMLENAGVDVKDRRVLVLGAGGAGRSVAKKLADGGARVYIYDKNQGSAEGVAREFDGVTALKETGADAYFAIINATGVGMHKTVGVSPVGKELIAGCEVAIDLIYNPAESEFLKIAKGLNKKTLNGKAMLFYQAYFAECIYSHTQPSGGRAKVLFEEYLKAEK